MGPEKNWSDRDDVILLRQMNADTPFQAKHGGKAQNRFPALLEQHSKADKVSATASGISETYQEKRQLLDLLSSLVNDHKFVEEARSEQEKKKEEEEVATGVRAREAAMQSLGKRKGSDNERKPPDKSGKMEAIVITLTKESE
ncbi:hypothetical protein BBJ28_00017868 [Nothophytophthora sp. Chile5]|nr:hypothetical protein BBJ28_00017868 [Nothophytophthora sp. Chile5]